jgi:hypothetical protein
MWGGQESGRKCLLRSLKELGSLYDYQRKEKKRGVRLALKEYKKCDDEERTGRH